ncbi:MAG: hypothetical protein R2827_12970 [Bdellovibrionales bacterium]
MNSGFKAPGGSSARTFVMVVNNGSAGWLMGYGYTVSCGSRFFVPFDEGTGYLGIARSCSNDVSTATSTTEAKIIVITYDGSVLKMFENNTEVLSVNTTLSTNALSSIKLGSDHYGSGNHFTGQIAEFLAYDSSLNTTDRQAVQTYLATKFGITLN